MTLPALPKTNTSIFALPARVMLEDAPKLRRQIQALIESGKTHLVIDLGAVELMDSSGLSVLVSARRASQAHAGSVVLANPSEDITALIELTSLHQIFPIYDDAEVALIGFPNNSTGSYS